MSASTPVPRRGPAVDPLRAAVDLVRVGPRGAEDRAAAGQDAAHLLDAQRAGVAVERTAPAVPEADELVPVRRDALAHDRPDDRVQPGAVAAAGEHADPHRCSLLSLGLHGPPEPRATPASARPWAALCAAALSRGDALSAG